MTQMKPNPGPLAALASDLSELEESAKDAYEQGCGSLTTVGSDITDVLVVSEADFPTAYNYVIEYFGLLVGQPMRVNFACGPAWVIPFNAGRYHQDLDDLRYECVGWKKTRGATVGKGLPLDSGGHPACPDCKSTMFNPPCIVCAYAPADGHGGV